ncbi:hypothetical protein L6164_036608 [Bauhinia variegata]|uniref:Uncharacterized protein n=1 Tax=Bauhinia variegata TaxID=167791 RepID=A0ACB9KIC7_BAUVA|nr:hypothetical protein L6164_036608 [Bauhinia variegata]
MAFLQPSVIQSKIEIINGKIFKNFDPYSFVSPSAYDTAWLAMIPDPEKPSQPMFKICLDWVLNNQHGEGFWGECDAFGKPTIESLLATLASMIALKKWNSGDWMIEIGLAFIEANSGKLLKNMKDYCPPCWFAIMFPAMVELAETVGLRIVFPGTVETVSYICSCRNIILQKEKLVGKQCYPPLLSYLEALPPSYAVSEEDISTNLSDDGSLFQCPSATAKAFMATKKPECLAYLQSLIHRCPNGVPQSYPMDEDLIKLSMVNHLQRLGLAEKFKEEIKEIMEKIYRNYIKEVSWVKPTNMIEPQLQKDALAFQLLRMHGYEISPLSLCWFLHLQEIRAHVEKDYECFTLAILNIYRASNLMFYGEYELEEARSFSRILLEKTTQAGQWNHNEFSRLHKLVN